MERRPCDTSKNCVSEAARPPPRHRSPHVHRRHSCWRPTSEGKAHVSDQEDDEDRRECGWRGRAGDRHRRGPAEQRSAVSPHSGRPRPADGHPVREHPHPAREPAARVGLGRRLGVDRRRWRFAHRLVHQGRHPVHDASGRTVCPGPACGLGLGRPRPADGHPVREHPHPAREPAARVGLGRRLGVDRRRWRFAHRLVHQGRHPVHDASGRTVCPGPALGQFRPPKPAGTIASCLAERGSPRARFGRCRHVAHLRAPATPTHQREWAHLCEYAVPTGTPTSRWPRFDDRRELRRGRLLHQRFQHLGPDHLRSTALGAVGSMTR